ncbi:hypothetical protein L9F63_007537, partial [Diploptera punctata]
TPLLMQSRVQMMMSKTEFACNGTVIEHPEYGSNNLLTCLSFNLLCYLDLSITRGNLLRLGCHEAFYFVRYELQFQIMLRLLQFFIIKTT